MNYHLMEMLTNLSIVIFLILFLSFLYKKLSTAKNKKDTNIQLISSFSIGMKERLILLKIEEEKFLIGATPNNISILHHFDSSVIPDVNEVKEQKPFDAALREIYEKQ